MNDVNCIFNLVEFRNLDDVARISFILEIRSMERGICPIACALFCSKTFFL